MVREALALHMAVKTHALPILLATAACGPASAGPPTPEIEWEGEWLRFGRSPDLAPQCAGVAPYMDRYVGALADMLEVTPTSTVDFFYVDDETTPCEAFGCVHDNVVFSLAPVQEHELVHAVRSFEGFSQLMLEEGAAELWGDDSRAFTFRSDTTGDILAVPGLASPDGLPAEEYGVSGRFHAMLASDAPEAVGDLLRATEPLMSRELLSAQMSEATGRSFGEWATDFAAYPACEHREYRDPTPACRSVRTVARCDGADAVEIEEYVGCADEETLGPRDGEIWKYVGVEIEQAGTYSLFLPPDLEAMQQGTVTLEECRGGCGSVIEELAIPQSFTPGRSFEATPGRYLLRLTLPESAEGWVRVWIEGECG